MHIHREKNIFYVSKTGKKKKRRKKETANVTVMVPIKALLGWQHLLGGGNHPSALAGV